MKDLIFGEDGWMRKINDNFNEIKKAIKRVSNNEITFDGYIEGTSKWFNGTSIIGTNSEPTVFNASGIAYAYIDDYYLNNDSSNIYKCTLAGISDTAKWSYIGNIKGQGSLWYVGTLLTGNDPEAIIELNIGDVTCKVMDKYLNNTNGSTYECIEITDTKSMWKYKGSLIEGYSSQLSEIDHKKIYCGAVDTASTSTTYKANSGLVGLTYKDGMEITIIPNVDSGLNPTFQLDSLTAYPILNKGTAPALAKIKANIPVTLVRIGSNFFIKGGGDYDIGDSISSTNLETTVGIQVAPTLSQNFNFEADYIDKDDAGSIYYHNNNKVVKLGVWEYTLTPYYNFQSMSIDKTTGEVFVSYAALSNTTFYLIKLNSNGTLAWSKTISTYSYNFIIFDNIEKVLYVGDRSYYIIKFDTNGNQLWKKTTVQYTITNITIGNDGYIYCVDNYAHQVLKVECSTGNIIFSIICAMGGSITRNDNCSTLKAMGLSNGNIAVIPTNIGTLGDTSTNSKDLGIRILSPTGGVITSKLQLCFGWNWAIRDGCMIDDDIVLLMALGDIGMVVCLDHTSNYLNSKWSYLIRYNDNVVARNPDYYNLSKTGDYLLVSKKRVNVVTPITNCLEIKLNKTSDSYKILA